ncbi:hypothetical protein Poly51_59830 [Rubripirellula tenax]|uniref:Uncharacterized protein n=3 Tax=Pirellulaceae TaxID=2691357 RepID=A0A5C6E852_9BACT|nr:hypothetical protein Poly51_59830 [Rubripirellula tenax]TWU51517.1 hypothetical protein Poly59_31090 [Rubripirellula reticaptiva]
MARTRLVLIATVTSAMLLVTSAPASAIVVQLQSASQVPFTNDYPKYAREQVRAAFQTENCGFIDGTTNMSSATVRFAGNTAALNMQLLSLSTCPTATLSVAFEEMEHSCDWRIVYSVKLAKFLVTVNLGSKRIELEHLKIPPSTGPPLKR